MGRRLLVKRDDLIGGNKTRTLEFLLARPGRALLTYSSLSAHHALAVQKAGQKLGLPSRAIILKRGRRGPALERLQGQVEVSGLLGALFATVRYRKKGTILIPPGGVSARGALGYLAAVLELETLPDRIYVPLGTGTTTSGLLAGLMLRGARTEVVAVRVADAIAGWPWLLWRRAKKALRLIGEHHPNSGNVSLRVVKADGAYGEPTQDACAACEAAGDLCLEPTYTGKTLAVLLREDSELPLFWHTHGPA